MNAPLRAVFLDVGNTLLSEVRPRSVLYAEVAQAHGLVVEPERMARLMRDADASLPARVDGGFRFSDPWLEAFIRKIFRDELDLPESRLPAVTAQLFERFEAAETFRAFPGARELLDALRERGLVVGVISNWSARLGRVLEVVGLRDALDPIVCSACIGAEKPDPAIFRAALELAGVDAAEALHAGDHALKDYAGARSAGLAAVLVTHPGTPPPPAWAGEMTRVGGLDELATYILGLVR